LRFAILVCVALVLAACGSRGKTTEERERGFETAILAGKAGGAQLKTARCGPEGYGRPEALRCWAIAVDGEAALLPLPERRFVHR
jgi:hypothetical protein